MMSHQIIMNKVLMQAANKPFVCSILKIHTVIYTRIIYQAINSSGLSNCFFNRSSAMFRIR